MNRIIFCVTCALFSLTSCSGVSKIAQHGSFVTQTSLSDTIFLENIPNDQRNIWVQIKNTTGDPILNIKKEVIRHLIEKGYKICQFPEEANVTLHANILQVTNNLMDPTHTEQDNRKAKGSNSISKVIGKHLHATAVGAAAGQLIIGDTTSSICGGLISALTNTFINDVTKVVKFSVVTDVQIAQKSDTAEVNENISSKFKYGSYAERNTWWNTKTQWKIYNTRITSEAQRINLKFHQAAPILKKSLASSITGIL